MCTCSYVAKYVLCKIVFSKLRSCPPTQHTRGLFAHIHPTQLPHAAPPHSALRPLAPSFNRLILDNCSLHLTLNPQPSTLTHPIAHRSFTRHLPHWDTARLSLALSLEREEHDRCPLGIHADYIIAAAGSRTSRAMLYDPSSRVGDGDSPASFPVPPVVHPAGPRSRADDVAPPIEARRDPPILLLLPPPPLLGHRRRRPTRRRVRRRRRRRRRLCRLLRRESFEQGEGARRQGIPGLRPLLRPRIHRRAAPHREHRRRRVVRDAGGGSPDARSRRKRELRHAGRDDANR